MSDYVEGVEWLDGVEDPKERESSGGEQVDVFIWKVESDKPCVACLSRNGERIELPASPIVAINWAAAQVGLYFATHPNCSCILEYQGRQTKGTFVFIDRTVTSINDRIEEVDTGIILPPGGTQIYNNTDVVGSTHTETKGGEGAVTIGGPPYPGSASVKGIYSQAEGSNNTSSSVSETETLHNDTDKEQKVIERWRTITTEYSDRYKDENEQDQLFRSLKIETIFLGHINR